MDADINIAYRVVQSLYFNCRLKAEFVCDKTADNDSI